MLKQNVPAKVASERLRHSTIGIALDLYSQVLREMREEAENCKPQLCCGFSFTHA
jgi:hypothetical protein